MKFILIILILIVFSSCTNLTSADGIENVSVQPTPTKENSNNSANSHTFPKIENASESIDKAEREKIETENEKFRIPSDGFERLDFENYTYPHTFNYNDRKIRFKLKDGTYEFDFDGDRGWFSLGDTFYLDLTGDNKKEAIVLLWYVSCGASCDGGAAIFYIYSLQNKTPKLLWKYETGSFAYGNGLKSFRLKDGEIQIELFGKCGLDDKNIDYPINLYCGKFSAKDIYLDIYGYRKGKFEKTSSRKTETPILDVKNYPSLIQVEN